MGDFNTTDQDEVLLEFLEDNELSNLVKFPTCYRNADNPSTIDLTITNKPKSFQNTVGMSAWLSDFHKMIVTSLKKTFEKCPPKTMIHRDMKHFDKVAFECDFKRKFEKSRCIKLQ